MFRSTSFQPFRLIACLAAFGISLSANMARAAEKYEIHIDVKAGSVWAMQSSTDSQFAMQASAQGQVLQNNESATGVKRESVATVKNVAGGLPTAMQVAFGRNCSNSATQNGQTQEQAFPLAGRTVNLRRGAGGQVESDLQNADAQVTQEVNQLLDIDTMMYPKEAVGVGDEWKPDPAKLRAQFQLGPDDKITLTCKLAGIGAVRGRKTYDIAITGSFVKVGQPAGGAPGELRMELGGVMQVDLLSGLPLQSDIISKMTLKGDQQVQGPNGPMVVNVTGGGKTVVSQSVIPQDGGGAVEGGPGVGGPGTGGPGVEGPGAGGPGGNPLDPQPTPPSRGGGNPLEPQPTPTPPRNNGGNPLDPQPTPPPNGGRNPLEPGAPTPPAPAPNPGPRPNNPFERPAPPPREPASPFSGSFKGEEMSADLTVTGNRVGGTVTKAGKPFKINGTLRGNAIVGAFDVSGVEFNFTATLTGDTLTFETDGNKYTLKKQGQPANNPPANNNAPAHGDAGGNPPNKPRNPLD